MKRNKFKRKLAILLVFVLVFAGLGTSAFAARPVKAATIQVVESQPLVVPAGSNLVSTDLIIRYDDGALPIAVASEGEAIVTFVSSKPNSTTYRMTYTKPDAYVGEGSETVSITVYNKANPPVPKVEVIQIQIEEDAPPPTEYIIDTVVMTDGEAEPTGGTAAGAGTYVENELVDLVASANIGYDFVGWYADAGLTNQLSTEPTYVITVTSDATYYAAFNKVIVPPTEYTITTVVKTDGTDSTIGGTAAGAGTYVENELVDLVASANSGYEFIGWYADTGLTNQLSTESTYVITVTSDATYYAAFNEVIVPPPPEDLLYVALGDSIITGTVAPSLPDETPFIYGFKVHLEDKTKRPVTMKNFGVDGDQTGHLLARLGGPEYDGVTADQTMIDNVKAAEVISVSIAGNNLMSAAKYTTYVFFFIKVTYYDFNNINPDKAEAGRAAVEIDFPRIIQQIRSHNPTAKIIVTDTYNPFNKTTDVGTDDEGNYDLVEYYLHRNGIGVNDVIRRVCSENSNVECAEVYSAFEAYGAGNKKEEITYMYITDTYYGFELRNPHPNNIGQGLIETAAENAYDRIH